MTREEVGRPITIKGMVYAPANEQGVVFLFGRLAPQLGFHVEVVRTGFPDCIARRRGKRCRIEFKFRASQYNYPPRGADAVVCWENDWEHRPRKYKHLEIIELKKYVGALPRVFAVGCNELERGKWVDRRARIDWSVPKKAQVDDLIVMYRTAPSSEIRDLWKVVGPFYMDPEWGLQAYLRVLVRLPRPVTRKELITDRTTCDIGVVRQNFRGKRDITDEWAPLYNKIIAVNPGSKSALREYQPD